ncbi:MAG: zinc ribbon domain-containing protein [Anaerolineales bacterium]|nr:zinc ribbon domain-containing protein [Anaerolineales bacterium]MCA9931492.1 zinc ribbon domain-containing protein [Anaerolineales bacterium]
MPMYEFACRECGHPFEKRLRMSQSSDAQECPGCGSMDTRRRIASAVAVGGGSHPAARAISTPPPSSPFS